MAAVMAGSGGAACSAALSLGSVPTSVIGLGLGVAALPFYIPGFACEATIFTQSSLASDLSKWLAGDLRVMVVSEQGIGNCYVYFYPSDKEAHKDAGQWNITSRIMIDIGCIDDPSELKELKRLGPIMPHNTIRSAARRCQQALVACKRSPFLQPELSDICPICCAERVPTVTMRCCSRDSSTNRICRRCQVRLKHCPFCRSRIPPRALASLFRQCLQIVNRGYCAADTEVAECGDSTVCSQAQASSL